MCGSQQKKTETLEEKESIVKRETEPESEMTWWPFYEDLPMTNHECINMYIWRSEDIQNDKRAKSKHKKLATKQPFF